jgi:Histidine kinase/Histidine kinase-, DNA gyrase B-, and HSP90-like ATPase
VRSLLQTQVSRRKPMIVFAGSLVATAALIPVYRLQGLSWPQAIVASVLFVWPVVALGWVVWRLLMRHGSITPLGRAIAVHALAAVLFSSAWTLVLGGAVCVLRPGLMLSYVRDSGIWQFTWGLILYGVLVQAARAQGRLREQELAAANAELQALRAQLNPHFLFNTLHSLTQLVREDPIATQDALERFGELMRYVLKAGREATADVALDDEIGFVRNYLALEQLRLGSRLRVVEDFDPASLELAVPPLLLQPLVENAVRHGLAPRREGGTIRLTTRVQDAGLMIEVSDDGTGADPDAWRNAAGLGLKAVSRQLKARFADACDLEVSTAARAGFTVRLRFPARIPMRSSA